MNFECTISVGKAGMASFSECGAYRYMLKRSIPCKDGLCKSTDFVNFVMLNPSTATQDEDDPTIRRCIGYAKSWDFAGLFITNIFALRSTDPKNLYKHEDPIGPENDAHLKQWASESAMIVCAWGSHGFLKNRGEKVEGILRTIDDLYCLKITQDGQPGHPLYLKADLQPKMFPYRG